MILTLLFCIFPSTDAVFPHGLKDCGEDADMTQYASQLTDGYAQSKWVAEQLVLRAIETGLPAAIYRLGRVLLSDFLVYILKVAKCLCLLLRL